MIICMDKKLDVLCKLAFTINAVILSYNHHVVVCFCDKLAFIIGFFALVGILMSLPA